MFLKSRLENGETATLPYGETIRHSAAAIRWVENGSRPSRDTSNIVLSFVPYRWNAPSQAVPEPGRRTSKSGRSKPRPAPAFWPNRS